MKQQYKPELQTKQVTLSIKVLDAKYCDENCVGFNQHSYGGYRCGVFGVQLKAANVMPDDPHFEDLVRCAKCRKAEIS